MKWCTWYFEINWTPRYLSDQPTINGSNTWPRIRWTSRATGKYTLKTKQPPSGKAVGGGLRIGEMERDALISHGTMGFLKESMMERSDSYTYHIGNESGLAAAANPTNNRFFDLAKDGPAEFNGTTLMNFNSDSGAFPVNIPFNTKMMSQECENGNIYENFARRDTWNSASRIRWTIRIHLPGQKEDS